MADYILTMNKVGRFIPPDRDLIKDITLSFFLRSQDWCPGAERSGKVDAAQDHGRASTRTTTGELQIDPWATRSACSMQEPQLDPDKERVRQHPRRCWRHCRSAANAMTRCWPHGPIPRLTTTSSVRKQGEIEKELDARQRAGISSARSRSPWMRCALLPPMPK